MSNPSVLVLVKNEAYWLPFVLKQTEGHFTNYVIYDVGSSDNTGRIIDWFYERNKDDAHIIVRKLPHVVPEVQGTFRNSMIIEGNQDIFFLLDGDELYSSNHIKQISKAARDLNHVYMTDEGWVKGGRKKRYGVFERVEVSEDLQQQYAERRGHHRLYTRDAFWTGTHPGERAFYKQDHKSEVEFKHITCWHLHNTLRSPKEADATRRIYRKGQKSYHPGNEMKPLSLIKEIPMLAAPIEDFPVSPALHELQELELC